jgi:8-oxo-dGTP diphosphatase
MTQAQPLVLVAAAALLDSDGRVLIAQRPAGKAMGGLWEFPGGKIEAGESPEDALVRELREELNIAVKPPCLAPFTFASHTYENFRLLMPLYVCRRWDGTPQPVVHSALKWVRPRELMTHRDEFPMPAADLPLLPMLRDLL